MQGTEAQSETTTSEFAVSPRRAAALLGISRAQLWKLHSAGKLPLPVRLGSRAPRWRVDELKAWLAAGCPERQAWQRMNDSETRTLKRNG